jgi:hypothetical protein
LERLAIRREGFRRFKVGLAARSTQSTASPPLVNRRSHDRIVPKLVMIVAILVAGRETEHPLNARRYIL